VVKKVNHTLFVHSVENILNNSKKNHIDTRHEARKLAIAFLYSYDFTEEKNLDSIEFLISEYALKAYDTKLFKTLVDSYVLNVNILEKEIHPYLQDWNPNQVLLIDKLLIKLAFLEIFLLKNVSPKIAINECLELAKFFSTEKSAKFINGVLAKIVNN